MAVVANSSSVLETARASACPSDPATLANPTDPASPAGPSSPAGPEGPARPATPNRTAASASPARSSRPARLESLPDKEGEEDYPLSFIGAGARREDMLVLAKAYLACGDWEEVRRQVLDDNLLTLNRRSTARRIGRELMKRLQTLSRDELSFFVDGLGDDARAMLWVAICRPYPFLRDLSEQLVAGRYADMQWDLPDQAVRAFIEDQKLEHPRLARTSPSTQNKLRAHSLAMLRDCGLRAPDGRITPLYPSRAFVALVRTGHSWDLLLFPRVGAFAEAGGAQGAKSSRAARAAGAEGASCVEGPAGCGRPAESEDPAGADVPADPHAPVSVASAAPSPHAFVSAAGPVEPAAGAASSSPQDPGAQP